VAVAVAVAWWRWLAALAAAGDLDVGKGSWRDPSGADGARLVGIEAGRHVQPSRQSLHDMPVPHPFRPYPALL
jgi:hypothetical protein